MEEAAGCCMWCKEERGKGEGPGRAHSILWKGKDTASGRAGQTLPAAFSLSQFPVQILSLLLSSLFLGDWTVLAPPPKVTVFISNQFFPPYPMAKPTSSPPPLNPGLYSHSPVHHAVAVSDHTTLSRIVSSLPQLPDPSRILTESDSLAHELLADQISAVLDRRDVPLRETPLHLAVRLKDAYAARILASAGADISLQNSAGWNPLQEALCRRTSDVALILLRYHHRSAWSKWRRRLPRLIAVLRRMRDFYMEISFHFESSVIPFVGKIAPSDTYRIWKRDGNLRSDTSLAGFDGLKMQRADQSFLFLGDGNQSHDIPSGSLLVLNHDDRKIFDAFENAGAPLSDSDIASFCSQTTVYRPGIDVTKAELVARTNWRRQEKSETVGDWKARVYDINNVVFSFRSRKVTAGDSEIAGSEQVLPLELDEDDDGYLVAENPSLGSGDGRRHSSFVREEREWVTVGRRSVDVPSGKMRGPKKIGATVSEAQIKEKEYTRSLRPSVWLTEQFPLKTEEVLPLLDILANKVKAVRRMRELLTTKFPPGTFPVKVAIPVVPTVKVVITFTKLVDLQQMERFYTPLSSPRLLSNGGSGLSDSPYFSLAASSSSSSSSSSNWRRRSGSHSGWRSKQSVDSNSGEEEETDPFAMPSGYRWTSIDDKSGKMKKCKSSSSRKSK